MRFILLLTVIFLSSCKNKKETTINKQQAARKETIANRQLAIKKEIEQVKADYYNKADSLDGLKEADTISAKHMKIIGLADRKKSLTLLKLQKEYDSLEVALKKY